MRRGVAQMVVCGHRRRRVCGIRRPSPARRRASGRAASRKARVCRRRRPQKPDRGGARWSSKYRRRRCPCLRRARGDPSWLWLCRAWRRNEPPDRSSCSSPRPLRRHWRETHRSYVPRQSCWRRSAPSEVQSSLNSFSGESRSSTRRSNDEARRAEHAFGFEVAAGDLPHQKLRSAGAPGFARSTATLVSPGSICLASSMSSKPMTAKSCPIATPACVNARVQTNRHNVVEAKRARHRLRKGQETLRRRAAARIIGRRTSTTKVASNGTLASSSARR